jgi:hypothetical protein
MSRPSAGLALLALPLLAACSNPQHDERTAREFVFHKLSTPQLGVVVGPAVVQANFALVDWTRGGFTGGRALLKKADGGWAFVACGGAELHRRPAVQRAGVPDGTAGVLVTKILREESRITDDRRRQLDQWRGLGVTGVSCPQPKAR